MKKLNVLFGFVILVALTFTSCYQEDTFDDNFVGEFIEDNDNDQGHSHDDDEATSIANYEVDGDFLIKKSGSTHTQAWMNNEAKHQIMWEHFAKMLDKDQRRWITEFVVFDGGGELLGYVEPINGNDLSQWRFALAIDVAYVDGEFDKDGEYTYTLIHEYAHILTLNETQIDANANACSTYQNQEGCTYPDSYMNQFQQRFWSDIMAEFEEAYDNYEEDAFYEKYQDHFVTDYAATNPEEDIAEVFTYFVTKDNMPQGGTIADEKVRSMYDYPELVQLRSSMRQGVSALPEAGTWKRAKQFKLQKYESGKIILRK